MIVQCNGSAQKQSNVSNSDEKPYRNYFSILLGENTIASTDTAMRKSLAKHWQNDGKYIFTETFYNRILEQPS